MIERDKKIQDGVDKSAQRGAEAQKRLDELQQYRFKSNCRLELPDSSAVCNIRSADENTLNYYLIKLILFQEVMERDDMKYELKINGTSVKNWIEDLKIMIERQRFQQEVIKLRQIQNKLKEYYSEDKKADIAVDELLESL